MNEPSREIGRDRLSIGISEADRRAARTFLERYAEASDSEFLVSAYQWVFRRGIDETGYVESLTQLFGGLERGELLRRFLTSDEFLASGGNPDPLPPLPEKRRPLEPTDRRTLEQYQDIWIQGRLVKSGVRECADRFETIREFCSRYRRPFTVLDLGANLAYFSIRLAETFDCTAVAVEGPYGDWSEEIVGRNGNPRVVLLKKTMSIQDLRALSEVEHFDVVLALSVIHHLEGSYEENLQVLCSLGDHLILELPFERGACRPEKVRAVSEAGLPEGAVSLGRGASHLEEGEREIVLLSCSKTRIEKAYLGTPRGGLDLEIESYFEAKRVRFKNKPEAREWIRGINLQTYLWFNGAWPHRCRIAEILRDKGTPPLRHRDIQPWNAVLQGDDVVWIDFDDPNHAFSYPDDGHLDRLIRLLTARLPNNAGGKAGAGPEKGIPYASGTLAGRSPFPVRLPVRWLGPVFNPSGYASELINFVVPLEMRIDLGIFHHNTIYSQSFVDGLPEKEKGALFRLRDRFANLSGGVVVSHNPGNSLIRPPDGDFFVGRTMFETDRLPSDWIGNCNLMDEIWVPSRFNRKTFAAAGVREEKIFVVPDAVDATRFDPAARAPLALPQPAAYNFLAVFEWSTRKGWNVLLAAYLREFSAEDDVCLHLRTYFFSRPDDDAETAIRRRIEEYGRSLELGAKPWPRIEILAEQVPEADLPGLYKAVDCLVAPSRGEGWGRPQHEAMMMGLPVIATAWSGNTEFMNEENSYLLNYRLVEAKFLEPELWQYRGHRWADPSESHLRCLMRSLEQDPDSGRQRGDVARRQMLENFSREPVAEKVVERLQEIERRLSTPALPAVLGRPVEVEEAPPAALTGLRLHWDGPTDGSGSLAHVNREMKAALRHRGRVGLVEAPEVDGGGSGPPSRPVTTATVAHRWPPRFDFPNGGLRVLMQPWEYGALPREWVTGMARCDEIWVYSEFLRRCYLDSGVDPAKVRVVPLGIDPDFFHPDAKPAQLPTRKPFRFLFVGGTIRRKGPDVLLKAYCEAFGPDDDVCLVVKDFGGDGVYRGQTLREEIRRLRRDPGLPEIVHLDEEWSADRIPGLYTACHCLVHPYRGEGFALPVLEAMACGLPVIVTGGGATDDFSYGDWAIRIPARSVDIGSEVASIPLIRNGRLLEPDPQALIEELRRTAVDPEGARRRGLQGSREARSVWTWDRAAAVVESRMADLAERRRRSEREFQALLESGAVEETLPDAAKIGDLSEARKHLEGGRFEESWSAACAAVESRPFHPEGFLLQARIAQAAGDPATARPALVRALDLLPRWKPALRLQKALRRRKGTRASTWKTPPGGRDPRLTVCLVVKDAGGGLKRALDSVEPVAHQVVVVDTGSTDGSVATARKWGAEVIASPWRESFSVVRNLALEAARGDWVLMLDADEELGPEGLEPLERHLHDTSAIAWLLPVRETDDETGGATTWRLRLFRNAPGLFFAGRVFEDLRRSLEGPAREWGLRIAPGEAPILHHLDLGRVASRDRLERNLRLLERDLEDRPGDPRTRHFLGVELSRMGRDSEAVSWLESAWELLVRGRTGSSSAEVMERILIHLSAAWIKMKEYRKVLALFDEPGLRGLTWSASLHFQRGLARMESGDPEGAADDFRRAIELRDEPVAVEPVANLLGVGPWHCLARCLEAGNCGEEAERVFREALRKYPDAGLVRFDLARFLADRERVVEALRILAWLVEEDPGRVECWKAGSRIFRRHPELAEQADAWTEAATDRFPADREVLLHRAEALLLRGRIPEAHDLWGRLEDSTDWDSRAALLLCRLARGDDLPEVGPEDEEEIGRALLRWRNRLKRASSDAVLESLHSRLETLRSVLPGAARRIEAELRRRRRRVPQPDPVPSARP